MWRHGHYHYQRVHHTSTASTSTRQGLRQWPTALITHIATPPPGQPLYQTMVTTIVNASTHTIARLNGARPEPQIMYVFLSFFSLFFRLLMIFLHLDYMYRVDDDNERPPHRTHNPLSGQPPHYTMHHHVTPWHYHRQRVHPHEKTN